jgi:N-acetylglutamate synthase-like GNAT family acetyltransferase
MIVRSLFAGPVVVARPSREADLDAVLGLVERCSDDTLYRRFHGATGRAVDRELRRIAAPTPEHRSWVALAAGDVRGTATLAFGRSGRAEAAFLVEDAWFRRGVGRLLFSALVAEARRAGLDRVYAWVQADNDRAVQFIRGVAPAADVRFAGGAEIEIAIPVDAVSGAAA